MLGRKFEKIIDKDQPTWGCVRTLKRSLNGVARFGDKAHKLAERLRTVRTVDDLYTSLVTEWQDPATVLLQLAEPSGLVQNDGRGPLKAPEVKTTIASPSFVHSAERMMYLDTATYLPDDIFVEVDRAAMATSLETRVPFLDNRVAELARRLPVHMKIHGNTSKWALRQVLYKCVPPKLIERPKMGFGVPIGAWLRGPLRDWAEALLDPSRMSQQSYLKPEPIQLVWKQHLSGHRDWTNRLWSVLTFQAWLEENT